MKIYSPPKAVGEKPPFDYNDFKKAEQKEEAWVDKIKSYAKQHGSGLLKGEEVNFPQGDGHARYVVFSNKELIHLPVGDAWHFPYIERLTTADIKKAIQGRKMIEKFFKNKK